MCDKVHAKHMYVTQIQTEGEGKEQKTNPLARCPYFELIQPTKPIMVMGTSSIYNLTHSKKVFIKESLIACCVCSESSKALLFVSFHSFQDRHTGAELLTFFCFLPTNESCQINRVPLTVECITQTMYILVGCACVYQQLLLEGHEIHIC